MVAQTGRQSLGGRDEEHLGIVGVVIVSGGDRPCPAQPPHGVDTNRPSLYDSYMNKMAVSVAREHLAEVIDDARRTGEPVYVTKRGRPVAVIVDPEAYERLLEDAEDTADRAALELARVDDDFVPWEQVKADLGLA